MFNMECFHKTKDLNRNETYTKYYRAIEPNNYEEKKRKKKQTEF